MRSRLFERVQAWAGAQSVLFWSVALLALGLAVRLVLLRYAPAEPLGCEVVNVAKSLATTGRYADAYGPGTGPTAHCAPLLPLLLSLLFRIFGMGVGGKLAMMTAASLASALAFALLPALAAASELPLGYGVLAGIAGALFPFNFVPQTRGIFDAPFTAAAFVSLCILICRIRARRRFTRREAFVWGIAAGLACLLNPAMLPVLAGWTLFLVFKHSRQFPRIFVFSLVAILCFFATVAPWAIRNYQALGSPIWTRSNFWLEVHVSNNDWLTADEVQNIALPNFDLVHPARGAAERAEVKRLGEIPYMREKRKQAIAWITNHKRRFLELTAERFRLFWIPRMARPVQTFLEAALTILALSGLVLLFRCGHASAWIFVAIVTLYPLVYYLVQVTPRYRLPIEPFLFLLAAYCLLKAAIGLDRRQRNASRSDAEFNTVFALR